MSKTDTRQANWRRSNPDKYVAHLAVQRAVKVGELKSRPARSAESKRSMRITINMMSPCRCGGYAGVITPGSITTVKTCSRW